MAKDYYVSLCQRKIRKIEKRIELGKKHLDPSKETKDTISRNTIRIHKKEQLLAKWQLKLEQREAELAAKPAVEETPKEIEVINEVDENNVEEQPAA